MRLSPDSVRMSSTSRFKLRTYMYASESRGISVHTYPRAVLTYTTYVGRQQVRLKLDTRLVNNYCIIVNALERLNQDKILQQSTIVCREMCYVPYSFQKFTASAIFSYFQLPTRRNLVFFFSYLCAMSLLKFAEYHEEARVFCELGCGRSYKRRSDMVRHMKDQCGVDPKFHCMDCGKPFFQKGNLRRHALKIHKILLQFTSFVGTNGEFCEHCDEGDQYV